MAWVKTDDYTGRETHHPGTIVERIAWALCARDSQDVAGYLQDDELGGVEALLQAMERRCGNERAEADFLGLPPSAVRRYLPAIKRLARDERSRRVHPSNPLMAMHLTASYWRDYLPEAEAAFSIAIEDARVARVAPFVSPADESPSSEDPS